MCSNPVRNIITEFTDEFTNAYAKKLARYSDAFIKAEDWMSTSYIRVIY